jgi:hypothetical protein
MLVQPLGAATECEVDLVRKRPDHGNGLRPWIPKQRPEFHLCTNESQRLNLNPLTWTSPCEDWSLTSLKEKLIKIGAKVVSHGRFCRLSDGRGRHPTAHVTGDFAADRPNYGRSLRLCRPEAFDGHALKSNRREECVQMLKKVTCITYDWVHAVLGGATGGD